MSKTPGGVVSVYKKYTITSNGFWERIRRFFAVDPNRSTGVPYVSQFRNPAPGVLPNPRYHDPVTVPAGDIAGNQYFNRDVRRAYARKSVVTQIDAAGLLQLGSAAAPRIADGDAGTKQLVEVKKGALAAGGITEALAKVGAKSVLSEGGMPPLPGKAVQWTQKVGEDAIYPEKYPCRAFT